jgi:TPR repeat protein
MYEHGIGVLRDFDQAAFWYGKAANQGMLTQKRILAGCMIVAGAKRET